MERSGAAEGEQRETARILTLLLQRETKIDGHVGVDDPHDARGRRDQIEPERRRDLLLDRAPRARFVELQRAGEAAGAAQRAKDDIGVGDGRRFAAAAVAGRTGIRARSCADRL